MTDAFPVCGSEHCITCGDDGTEMTVLELNAGDGLAWCTADELTARPELVEVSLLASVAAGDHILVHAGTAIAALGAQP